MSNNPFNVVRDALIKAELELGRIGREDAQFRPGVETSQYRRAFRDYRLAYKAYGDFLDAE